MFQMDAPFLIHTWRSDARTPPARTTLSEVFPEPGAEAAAIGFVLTRLGPGATPVLWIQDRLAQRETGRPFLAGLGLQRPFMVMQLSRPADVMAAVEEGLRCREMAAVIAEIRGDPAAVNFTAMKRLAVRAASSAVPCWLIRQAATANLSPARDRWRIASLPSTCNPDDPHAPGAPCWRVELFRSRERPPGEWVVRLDREAQDLVDLVATFPDGPLAQEAAAVGRRADR